MCNTTSYIEYALIYYVVPRQAHRARRALVTVNGVGIGDITIDASGQLKFFLDTSVEAKPGLYEVTVTDTSRTSTPVPNGQSARLSYTLQKDLPVRTHLPDETTIVLTVPTTMKPQASLLLYLPVVEVRSQE